MLNTLLILIFLRPFISSLAFPCANAVWSVLILGWLALWILRKGISLKEISPIKYPLLLFILALFISFMFSQDKINSINEIQKYVIGILLLVIVASLTPGDKNRMIMRIIIAGLVISLLAIYQYFFGFQNLLNYITKHGIHDSFALDYVSRRRPFLPFVTPNTLAGYLAMIIPLTLIHKNKTWLILPLTLSLLLTKSLGGLLSIFLGLIIYFYLRGELKKPSLFFLLGAAILIGLVLVSRFAMQKLHTQPIFSAIMRLNYWRDTLRIIKAHPWTGVGLGNFNLAYSRYSHNSYLQIWAEMGIPGIAAIIWLIISVLKSTLKNLKNISYRTYAAGLIIANIIFLLHNFVDFTFFLPEVSILWWVIMGLLLF